MDWTFISSSLFIYEIFPSIDLITNRDSDVKSILVKCRKSIIKSTKCNLVWLLKTEILPLFEIVYVFENRLDHFKSIKYCHVALWFVIVIQSFALHVSKISIRWYIFAKAKMRKWRGCLHMCIFRQLSAAFILQQHPSSLCHLIWHLNMSFTLVPLINCK